MGLGRGARPSTLARTHALLLIFLCRLYVRSGGKINSAGNVNARLSKPSAQIAAIAVTVVTLRLRSNRFNKLTLVRDGSVTGSAAFAASHDFLLTLLPKSQLSAAAGEDVYFDVTGNSTPDSAPLGSINRARWPAEVASRKARMGR